MSKMPSDVISFQADVIKALGHPLRIEIVNYLKKGEKSVSDIIKYFDADPSNISRHLAILKRVGILSARKSGLNVFYSVAMPCVPDFLVCLGQLIKKRFGA